MYSELLTLSLIYRLSVASTHMKARCTVFCPSPSQCNSRLCQLPVTVSVSRCNAKISHSSFAKTNYCSVSGKLCAPDSASFCCACQFHRRQKILSTYASVSRSKGSKANDASCVTFALSNCRNEALTNDKLACGMKAEVSERIL